MSKENRTKRITKNTGKCWGLICIIPFGWIFFLASLIHRKNDVIKYGTLKTGVALDVLHNYIVGFIIVSIFVVIFCIANWTRGILSIPNLIALIAIPITYSVVVNKILRYEEEKQSKTQKTQNIKKSRITNKTKQESTKDYNDELI